jgi:hypothetical protein
MFNHQKRCSAVVARPKLSGFINTWLQPGVKSKAKRQPFQRLSFQAKTVETVFCVLLSVHRAEARC